MFNRYAIFYTPKGALAEWGARWLGWDSRTGQRTIQPDLATIDVEAVTQRPQKYGFHATLKAPFTLAPDASAQHLKQLAADFAKRHASVDVGTLALSHQNGFVALRPEDAPQRLQGFAAAIVTTFDPLRAPMTHTQIAHRRKARLTPRQDQQMLEWGYPFIFEDFQFHMTLTGRISNALAADINAALRPQLAAVVPTPCSLDAITVMGEDEAGAFHQLGRYELAGKSVGSEQR